MNEHWQRIRELFDKAAESSNPEAVLDAECGDSGSSVRLEVEKLLALRQKHLAVDSPVFQLTTRMENLLCAPGDRLGTHYRVTRFLASGGMGEVYAAIDEHSGEPVAVKLLRHFSNVARDRESALARFAREAELAACIKPHRNVCRMLDVDLDAPVPFCVQQLLQGETLADRLAKTGKLTQDEALRITSGVCDGLQAAHAAGVIHRDLKPGNILLRAETGEPVIIDFGLATTMAHRDAASLTKTGDMLGTLAYVAPEILEEERVALGPAADLYSLGVILFEMLTGKKPHAAESPLRLVMQRARRTDLLPAIRTLGLPEVWLEVIARCLESDPARRYGSAAEVREKLLAGRASWRFRLRDPRARLGMAAVVAVAALGLGWQWWRSEPEPASAAVAEMVHSAQRAALQNSDQKALQLLEEAVRRDPDFLNAHSLLAVAYAQIDQIDKAREQMLIATAVSDKRWRLGRLEKHLLDACRGAVVGEYAIAAQSYQQGAAVSKSASEREFLRYFEALMWELAGRPAEALPVLLALNRQQLPAARVQYARALSRKPDKQAEAEAELLAVEQTHTQAGNTEGLAALLLERASSLPRTSPEVRRRDLERARTLALESGNALQDLRAQARLALLEIAAGQVEVGIELASAVAERAQALRMDGVAARALGDVGYALHIARRTPEAVRFLEQGVELAERSKLSAIAAVNRVRLAEVFVSPPLRRIQDAIRMMEPGIPWYRRAGRKDTLATVLVKWGGILSHDPARLAESERALLEALALGEQLREEMLQAMALQRLAGVYGSRNYPKSLAYFNRALPLFRSTGVIAGLGQASERYSMFGDFGEARKLLAEFEREIPKAAGAVQRKSLTKFAARVGSVLRYREGACVHHEDSEDFELRGEMLEFRALADECRDMAGAPVTPLLKGHRTALQREAEAADRLGDPHLAGRFWNAAARMALRLGLLREAEQEALRARELFRGKADRTYELEAELVRRKVLQQQLPSRSEEEAAATLEVLRLAREVGYRDPAGQFNGRKDLQRLWESPPFSSRGTAQ